MPTRNGHQRSHPDEDLPLFFPLRGLPVCFLTCAFIVAEYPLGRSEIQQASQS